MKSIFLLCALLSLSHATSLTDPRVKIAVVDTGIIESAEIKPFLCKDKPYDATNTNIEDTNGHGTNIASIIVSGLDPTKVCIVIIKYYMPGTDAMHSSALNSALSYVANHREIKYVNISSGGMGANWFEEQYISNIISHKNYVVVAAGNEWTNLQKNCNYYPACYKFSLPYFHVVGNGESELTKYSTSNYGSPPITDWEAGAHICAGKYAQGFPICMSGTSQATALYTNHLIKLHLKSGAPWFNLKNGGKK